jgi:hypothetical protein
MISSHFWFAVDAGADDTDDFSDGIVPADAPRPPAMDNKHGVFINTAVVGLSGITIVATKVTVSASREGHEMTVLTFPSRLASRLSLRYATQSVTRGWV